MRKAIAQGTWHSQTQLQIAASEEEETPNKQRNRLPRPPWVYPTQSRAWYGSPLPEYFYWLYVCVCAVCTALGDHKSYEV